MSNAESGNLIGRTMTNKEYHATPALSKSNLFHLAQSPAHFRYETENPSPQTSAMVFGSALHKWVLEKEDFEIEFIVAPDVDRRTSAGKALWSDFIENSQGKSVITAQDFETIDNMRNSIYQSKYAKALLSGQVERSVFWQDEITGVDVKCRPDVITHLENLDVLVDLKSCNKAETDVFMRDCLKYGYDVQAAMYKEGCDKITGKSHTFVFVAVEKTPPYAVNILQVDKLFLAYGYDRFRELLGLYADCTRTGNWFSYNGFSGAINNLSIPSYLIKNYE